MLIEVGKLYRYIGYNIIQYLWSDENPMTVNNRIICEIKHNDTMLILRTNSFKKWLKVIINDKVGWVKIINIHLFKEIIVSKNT